LNVLTFVAARAVQPVLYAIDTLRAMNAEKVRSVPATAPTAFMKPRLPPVRRRCFDPCRATRRDRDRTTLEGLTLAFPTILRSAETVSELPDLTLRL